MDRDVASSPAGKNLDETFPPRDAKQIVQGWPQGREHKLLRRRRYEEACGPTSRGLSLAELLVAMAVTSMALLAMIGIFVGGLRLMTRGEAMTASTEAGREMLESIKEGGFAYLPASDSVFDGRNNDPPVSGFPPPPYPMVDQKPVLVRVEELRPGLKSVSVEVYGQPDRPPVILETYFVEPPP